MKFFILFFLFSVIYSTQLAASCNRYRIRAKVLFNKKYPRQLQLIIYAESRSQRTFIIKKQDDVFRLAPFINKVVRFEGSISNLKSDHPTVYNTNKVALTIADPLNMQNDLIKLNSCK